MPKGRPPLILTKDNIISAQSKTLSNRAAARFLGVSYNHYKKWAKLYIDEETGKNLFDKHLNRSGKGIPKFLKNKGNKNTGLIDMLEGRVDISHYTPQKIKESLIRENLIKEECNRCGFHERRVLDYKIPLLLNFRDNNKKNYKLENLQLLCYNCFFMTVGDPFTIKQIEYQEGFVKGYREELDWELDDFQKKQLEKIIDLPQDKKEDDIISYT